MTQMKDRQSQIWNQIQKTQQTVTRNSKEGIKIIVATLK